MALTLAEAKVGYADKVEQNVIDEFRRSSILLDKLTFDDTISPTGGSNLVYGYQRLYQSDEWRNFSKDNCSGK